MIILKSIATNVKFIFLIGATEIWFATHVLGTSMIKVYQLGHEKKDFD